MKSDECDASCELYCLALHMADCDLIQWEVAYEAQTGSLPERRLYEEKRKAFEAASFSFYGLLSAGFGLKTAATAYRTNS